MESKTNPSHSVPSSMRTVCQVPFEWCLVAFLVWAELLSEVDPIEVVGCMPVVNKTIIIAIETAMHNFIFIEQLYHMPVLRCNIPRRAEG